MYIFSKSKFWCSAHNDVVSKTLLVKVKGSIFEEKLASDFCLQLVGWCPCLNCREFVPPVQSVKSQRVSCNKNSEMLRLKRKTPEKFGEPSKKPHNEVEEKEDSENHIAERFQFDNIHAVLTNCKSLRRVSVLKTLPKTMTGHLEIFTLGE